MDLLKLIYRFLGQYDDLDSVWLFFADDGGNGLTWGGLIMFIISIFGAMYFYLAYTRSLANRAVLKNWWKRFLYTAIVVFALEELVLAGIFTAANEESNYFANLAADSGKLILFSLFNAVYAFVPYFMSSLLLRYFSKNARYIPFRKK